MFGLTARARAPTRLESQSATQSKSVWNTHHPLFPKHTH